MRAKIIFIGNLLIGVGLLAFVLWKYGGPALGILGAAPSASLLVGFLAAAFSTLVCLSWRWGYIVSGLDGSLSLHAVDFVPERRPQPRGARTERKARRRSVAGLARGARRRGVRESDRERRRRSHARDRVQCAVQHPLRLPAPATRHPPARTRTGHRRRWDVRSSRGDFRRGASPPPRGRLW